MNPKHILALLPLAAGLVAGLGVGDAPPAAAQRPTPTAAPTADLTRYATRHALPALGAPGGAAATTVLRVTNSGWVTTGLVVVELAPAPRAGCAAPAGPRVAAVLCTAEVGPMALAAVDLGTAGANGVLVYTVAAGAGDPCGTVARLRDGTQTIAEWEAAGWSPGAPVTVHAVARTASAVTGFLGEPSLSVLGRRRGSMPTSSQALPVVWPASAGGRAQVMNTTADCANVRTRYATDDAACPPATTGQVDLAAYSAAGLPLPAGGAAASGALMAQAPGEIAVVADRLDASGWLSVAGQPVGPGGGAVLTFPFAVGALPGLKPELWITNRHVTATTQVDLVMFDGNGALHKIYHDPVALCAGATRRYDVAAVAGEVPPTTGRGGNGPPQLSLRAESLNTALAAAPPIAGVMVLESDFGVTAYHGMEEPAWLAAVGGEFRRRGLGLITVVPGVKRNVGQPPVSTLLAVAPMGTGTEENGFYADFYDKAGKLVVGEVQGRLGDSGSVMDLAGPRAQLPNGFEGTVVVRGLQGYGRLAVVAIDRPTAGDARPGDSTDALTSVAGLLLPRLPDPNLPTPTPLPTRPPTVAPTPTDEPTPTPHGDRGPIDSPFALKPTGR